MRRTLTVTLLLIICLGVQSVEGRRLTPSERKLLAKKPLINQIIISGNESFSADKVKSKLYSDENGFWQSLRLKRRNHLAKVNLTRDKVLLDYFYRSQGFIDADIKISFIGDSLNRNVDLYVDIDEGSRYEIKDVRIGGDTGKLMWRIRSQTNKFKTGQYFNYYLVEEVRQGLKEIFSNRGYPYALIDISLVKNTDAKTVELLVDIRRGKLVVFGDVIVDTTLITSPRVFEKEIAFEKGETYSRHKFYLSQRRLIRTNLFSFVTLEPPDSMSSIDSLMPNFRVRAVERLPRFVNLSTGAGQDERKDLVWDFSGSFGSRNLAGTARKVQLQASTSFAVITDWRAVNVRFEFAYTEPYLFGIRMPLLTTFYFEPGIRSPIQDYDIEEIGLEATVIREFSLKTRLAVTGSYEQFNITAATPEDAERYKNEEGISINRKLIFYLERDSRPELNKFNPSWGSYTQYRLEYVGGILGGDNDFVKLLFDWAKYNELGRDGVLAWRFRFGWVNEFGRSEDVPTRDRFYLGGGNSIRGFSENTVGPLDSEGDPIGGEATGLFNLEIRRPFFWRFWSSLFFDSGYNTSSLGDVSLDEFVASAGVGIQFISPAGPIRLDYARRIAINDVRPGGRLHFGILYAF